MRVIIVSDVRLFRQGLALVLERDGRLRVAATAERVTEAAAGGAREVDAVLLDMGIPGALDGVPELRRRFPAAKVIAVGLTESESDVLLSIEAGVDGYAGRQASVDGLVKAVESAHQAELRCSPRIADALRRRVAGLSGAGRTAHLLLTPREREVVGLIDRGLTNKAIAGRLSIELSTVKNHVHNILAKLQVQTRGEAAARLRSPALASRPRRPELSRSPAREH